MTLKIGLNLLKRYSPNFDLPERKKKQIKFIIIHYTGMNKESLELVNLTADNITLMAAQSGANAVFIAPFNLAELVATVERFINDIASID